MSKDTVLNLHASPVAEGVRIQIGTATAFAVRKENKDVALRIRREYHPARDAMARVPFLRGIVRLVSGTAEFMDGVFESAQLDPQRIVKGSRFEQRFAELFRIHPTSLVAFGSAIAILLLFAALVILGPWALARFALPALEMSRQGINAAACAARVLGGLVCAALVPRLRVVNRLCMYRGAINKVLNTPPDGDGQVSRERAQQALHLSRKSDAAFIVAVLLLSVIAFALVRTFTLPVQLLVRALIVLIIAALLNEPVRLLENAAGKSAFATALHAPLAALERLMVRRPHEQMVEVAVYAYNAARENDR